MKKTEIYVLRLLLVLVLSCRLLCASAQLTAAQVLDKACAKIEKASGISGDFHISQNGQGVAGSYQASASKFALITPGASTWFNGRYMWTYNKASGETTLVVPGSEEIAETNPLAYMRGYKSGFEAAWVNPSGVKAAGTYDIRLKSKSNKSGVKQVDISLDKKTMMPLKFQIYPRGGSPVVVTVSNLSYNRKFAASAFEYPKNRYPKVKIIDLR